MTISALKTNLDNLSIKDRDFASSLIASFDRYGSLSAKQLYWVMKLAEKATTPAPVTQKVDLVRMTQLFQTALGHGLKNPAIRIGGFKLSPAKAGSVNFGSTYVKSGATYLGKISAAGDWSPARDAGQQATEAFTAITKFACDPVGSAAAEGHATGSCCFCARELSDAGSIEVGYGPICAEKYGLPHNPKGHGLKASVGESHGHEDVVHDYDAQEYVSRDEEGYGWEDRALAGAYSAR